MFQLFNRFAWGLSICLGLIITVTLWGRYLDFWSLIIGWIIAAIIKSMIFSDSYIKERVRFFADQLSIGNPVNKTSPSKETITDTQDIQEEINTVSDNSSIQQHDLEIEQEVFPQEDTYKKPAYAAAEESDHSDSALYQFNPSDAISRFFSENILAKLWGILVFLGVLFFLALIGPAIYNMIWPVGKIVIGFAIGFGCFAVGVWLDKRWLENEGRIVMGTAILINYLVILGWRYLLDGNAWADDLLSVWLTFMFLILNTLFAIATSLVYKSHTLLIFSFIFAYINPLIIGAPNPTEPYTLLGYTMIVSLGALFMSYSRKDILLFVLSFILWSILILIASPHMESGNWWIAKLLCVNTLGVISLYVSTIFRKNYKLISEYLIGWSFFLIGLLWLLWIEETLTTLQFTLLSASSIWLMSFAYFFSGKWSYLYSLSSLATVMILSPAILVAGVESHTLASLITIGIFALLNIWAIFTRENLSQGKNLPNLTTWLIIGALFLSGMVYSFWNVYFPGMWQWFVYLGLAAIYTMVSFMVVQKVGVEVVKKDENFKNIFYMLSAIGVSLFSLAIVFVFANTPQVVSIIWLLEANILFFVFSKTREYKVVLWGLILFIIGCLRLVPFLENAAYGQYGMLVTFSVVLASLIYNISLLYPRIEHKDSAFWGEISVIHNVFHIIALGTVTILIQSIFFKISNDTLWYICLYYTGVLVALSALYGYFSSISLKVFLSALYILALISHVILFNAANFANEMNIVVSIIITILFAGVWYIYKTLNISKIQDTAIALSYMFYLFAITTLYVYYYFPTTFSVTLYWGVLGSVLLGYGISQDVMRMRTLGLYLISLTAGKIFFFDIWAGFDDAISRVVALMVVGMLMIAVSTMYTRKYGNTLNSEFNPSNLFPENTKIHKDYSVKQESVSIKETQDKKSTVQQDIESVNISWIIWVRLLFNGEDKPVQIRAENLIKIAKILENTYKKKVFKAWELSQAFSMISQNYKSDLSPAQYKKIKDLVEKFVELGGSIEFVKQ